MSIMLASQAHVATERASRYLTQLCEHVSKMSAPTHHRPRGHSGGDAPPTVRHAEWSDSDGIIDFSWGRCTLWASGSELVLLVEAESQQNLQLVQDAIAARLDRIGRRDQLTVTWNQAGPDAPASGPATGGEQA
jgi:hypothetical protein